jgi:hypothetical protein
MSAETPARLSRLSGWCRIECPLRARTCEFGWWVETWWKAGGNVDGRNGRWGCGIERGRRGEFWRG